MVTLANRASRRRRRRIRGLMRLPGRVPAVVWWITALYVTVLLAYSVLLPIYRAPDEAEHVDLAHLLSEEWRYPAWDDRDLDSGVARSLREAHFEVLTGHLTAEEATPRAERGSFAELAEPGRDTRANHITQHPPLHYLVAGTAERLVEAVAGEPRYDVEVWWYRVLSVLLVAPLPLLVWWISRQLRLPRHVSLAATLVPLAVPQFLHIGSVANNDSLLLLTMWLSTALAVRIVGGDLRGRTALLAGLVSGIALLTKGFALVLPVFLLAGFVVAARRGEPAARGRAWRGGALYTATAFVLGGWWWVRNLLLYGELNPTRFYEAVPIRDDVEVDVVQFVQTWAGRTTQRFWGSFGWFNADLARPLVALATMAVVAGLVVGCARRDRVAGLLRSDRLLLAMPLALLVAAQFGFALRNHALTGAYAAMHGRYWFGALAGMAVVVGLGWAALLGARARWLPLAVLGAAVVLHTAAIRAVLEFFWGAPDSSVGDRVDAVVAWSPLPAMVLLGGALALLAVSAMTVWQLGLVATSETREVSTTDLDADAATPTAVPTGNTYDKYASKNPIERRLMGGFMGCLDELLPADAPRAVLEVGMGEGMVSQWIRERFPEARLVGVDLPDDELGSEWRERGLTGGFADIARLPFQDQAFDLVLAIEVLEHVPDPASALDELARVATGHLVLSVPREPIWRVANMARGKYLRDLGNTPGHIQHWSRRGFAELVGSRFETTQVRTPFPWTMVAARIRG